MSKRVVLPCLSKHAIEHELYVRQRLAACTFCAPRCTGTCTSSGAMLSSAVVRSHIYPSPSARITATHSPETCLHAAILVPRAQEAARPGAYPGGHAAFVKVAGGNGQLPDGLDAAEPACIQESNRDGCSSGSGRAAHSSPVEARRRMSWCEVGEDCWTNSCSWSKSP